MTEQPAKTMHNAVGLIVVDTRSPAEAKWEKFTTLPMIFLSFIFIVGYSVLILDDRPMKLGFDKYLFVMLGIIWLAFIVDYFVRLVLSADKRIFLKRNVIDLISMIIPFARPFLLLMYLSRLRIFRGRGGTSVRGRLIVYAVSFAVMYVYVISIAEYAAERSVPGATITNYGDAVWWAMETISTVGYGDMIPVSFWGRMFASLLMLGGMVIVGAATGTAVSYLNEKVQVLHKRNQAHTPEEHQAAE
jgi:voltage-gated potassium channel